MARQMRIVSASGILGYGYPEESLNKAMEYKPDFLGCDCGSTDGGPYYLGAGEPFVSRVSFKRDASLLVKAALGAGIPLLLGSCTGGGGDGSVDFAVEVMKEIAAENGLHCNLGVVYCEQDKGFLKQQLKQGKIATMGYFPELTERDIDEAEHIVGMMGAEVFTKALSMGADIVIAGRTSDTSIFAGIPVRDGFDPGLAWHAAKILECGAASTQEVSSGDCIIVTLEEDCFYVEPANPALHHTPVSVAAHSLYENGSPFEFFEPGGSIDIREAKYEAVSDRKVRVSGSRFVPAQKYTVKLEAAARVGYRTIAVMGTRDPILIPQLEGYEATVRATLRQKVRSMYGDGVKDGDYSYNLRKYGINAVMGEIEARHGLPHEVGIIVDVVAKTPDLSKSIGAMARTFTLHHAFPNRKSSAGNMGVAFSPSDAYMGAVYRFNMEHLLETDDPVSLVDIRIMPI